MVLDRTPLYAESGGQVGDSGVLIGPSGQMQISDTQRPIPGLFVHIGTLTQGSLTVGDMVTVQVDAGRRRDIMRNHTATHLLHRALRDVLGEHAAQAGSLVAPDRLRFDFSHMRPLSPADLHEVQRRINAWIRADTPVSWAVFSYQEAINQGAIALFGEKYTDQVRMVTVGCGAAALSSSAEGQQCSRELCGGTHVEHTGELGYFRILAESSVAAGIRRIEAVTGQAAEEWVDAQAAALREIAGRLGVPTGQVLERVDAVLAELRQRQHELSRLQAASARASLQELLGQVQQQEVAYLAARVPAQDAAQLREMGDWLREKIGSGVIVLGAVLQEKPQILVVVTRDLLAQGYHAGNLVKALAALVGGGGGGRADMAQAGGRDASKLDEALSQVGSLLAGQHAARQR